MPEVVGYQKRRAPTRKLLIYDASTRVLVRPIGLDMAEVGGSNPPGPTKFSSFCFYSILFFLDSRVLVCFCVWTLPLKGIDLLAMNSGLNDYFSDGC